MRGKQGEKAKVKKASSGSGSLLEQEVVDKQNVKKKKTRAWKKQEGWWDM